MCQIAVVMELSGCYFVIYTRMNSDLNSVSLRSSVEHLGCLDTIMKIYKMLTKNVTEKLILVRESKIFLIQHVVQVRNKILFCQK